MDAIRLLVTGGTFDKEYNELDGELIFRGTHVMEMLDRGRCKLPVKLSTIMMIDSLDMTYEDRENIFQNCKNCKEDKIVITHGTDTMVETAIYLAESIQDKTIVLTGAMVPFAFGSSDGLFNLGAAIAFVQSLPKGVYVAMNGKFFKHDNVRKNQSTGLFEVINAEE